MEVAMSLPSRSSLFVIPLLALSTVSHAQSAPQSPPLAPVRDPQAIVALRQAFAAMGGALPSDSVATGTVTIVEGSRTETGTIRILTRSHDQTVEDIQTAEEHRVVVFSRIQASETRAGATRLLPFEPAESSQCYDFPLPLVAWALDSPDAAVSDIGIETLNGQSARHIRLWNTFASIPKLRPPSEFTIKDLWLDPTTGLPLKLSYEKREGGGSSPRMRMEISYSDYRQTAGVSYPHQIRKTFNGVLWTSITVDTVSLNTGLNDTDFPLPTGGNQ
jgi:hypothetical protein